jgi:uncharacterized protein
MQELHAALLALQELDDRIMAAEVRVQEFAPQFETLEAPVTAAERELEATRTKLEELRAEQHRLQKNAQQKQERLAVCQERMTKVRNEREQTAVKAETDLVRRALEADTADLTEVSEQATRTDLKLDDIQRQLDKASADIAARRAELEAERGAAESELAQLKDQRENAAVRLDQPSRRLYERVRGGKSRLTMAPLTDEGACGNCFNILPVQEQLVVRRGESLHRCEGCGVILYAT